MIKVYEIGFAKERFVLEADYLAEIERMQAEYKEDMQFANHSVEVLMAEIERLQAEIAELKETITFLSQDLDSLENTVDE